LKSSLPERQLDRRREEFPTLAAGAYLLNHSLGPMPRAAGRSLAAYCERWQGHAEEEAWGAEWWGLPLQVADSIARILGAAAGSVTVQPSASLALSAAISCLEFGPGKRNRVVTSALDFPSAGYIWDAQRRLGAEVLRVPSDDGIVVPEARILEAINEETCLVALSHVTYCSSQRLDPRPIVERAHAVGALVLLDVYQSVGIVELEAAAWGVDFLVGGTIKWLCGGPACGFLYVRPELSCELEPRLTGWFAHREPLAFDSGSMEYADDARRFAQGTPSIPALYSCLPGLEIVEQVGLAAISRESRRRTERMVAFALERGWRLNCPAEVARRGGSVMIQVERPQEAAGLLAERGVFCDWRPRVGLRLSPHFFNTDAEVEQALAALAEVVG